MKNKKELTNVNSDQLHTHRCPRSEGQNLTKRPLRVLISRASPVPDILPVHDPYDQEEPHEDQRSKSVRKPERLLPSLPQLAPRSPPLRTDELILDSPRASSPARPRGSVVQPPQTVNSEEDVPRHGEIPLRDAQGDGVAVLEPYVLVELYLVAPELEEVVAQIDVSVEDLDDHDEDDGQRPQAEADAAAVVDAWQEGLEGHGGEDGEGGHDDAVDEAVVGVGSAGVDDGSEPARHCCDVYGYCEEEDGTISGFSAS